MKEFQPTEYPRETRKNRQAHLAEQDSVELHTYQTLRGIWSYLADLYANGASLDELVDVTVEHERQILFIWDVLKPLIDLGANPTHVADTLPDGMLGIYLDELFDAGAVISPDRLLRLPRLNDYAVAYRARHLLAAGVTSGQIIAKMTPEVVNEHCSGLIEKGVDIASFIDLLHLQTIARHLPVILEAGGRVDFDALMNAVGPIHIAEQLPTLVQYGATVDIPAVYQALTVPERVRYARQFQAVGFELDTDTLVNSIRPKERKAARGWLQAIGIHVDGLPGFALKRRRHVHPERPTSHG